jgi:hypothetical protein
MDGQRERECAALAGLALNPDAPAVVFHNLFADRQAQARAFGLVGQRVAHLLELLEDLLLIAGAMPIPESVDADNEIIAIHGCEESR